MKHLKYYEKGFNEKIEQSAPLIALKMSKSSDREFSEFLDTEFIQMFEEIIWSTTFTLIRENLSVSKWLKEKWNELISGIKSFLQNIGSKIKDSLVGEFIMKLKQKIQNIQEECLEFFDSMKKSVIEHDLINPDNTPNFKKITEMVMEIFKEEKQDIEPDVKRDIENNIAQVELKESLRYGSTSFETIESIILLENRIFFNRISYTGLVNENIFKKGWGAFKNLYHKLTTTGQEAGADTVTSQEVEQDIDGQNLVTFNISGADSGQNITQETIANSSTGIFGKLLVKLGVESPRMQVALSKLSFILIPVVIAVVMGIFAATGGVAPAAAGAIGGAFLAPAFSIFTVVCALFFIFGVFLLMCWFRQPYPTLENYIQYLEAWFKVYPTGIRTDEDIIKQKRGDQLRWNLAYGTKRDPYEDITLDKASTCRLFRKLNSLMNTSPTTDEVRKNIQKVEKELESRDIFPDSYQTEWAKCVEKEKEKDTKNMRMVSVGDRNKGFQAAVASKK